MINYFHRWPLSTLAALTLIWFCVLTALASPIDESFSLTLANSLELPEISKKVVRIEVFIGHDGNPHIPPDYKANKPATTLSQSEQSHFFYLLGKTGRSKRTNATQVTKDVLGCLVWTNNATPGYLFLRNLQDGRWYLHFYSTRDSVGGFNQALGDFLWQMVESSPQGND